MADYISQYTEEQAKEFEKQIETIYKQARLEVKAKLEDFERRHSAKDVELQQKLQAGKITKEAYQDWLRGQVFQEKQWTQRLRDITNVYIQADKKAREILDGTQKNVFITSANYAAYDIDKHTRSGVAFNLYDKHTVERLIKDNPKMLPEWKINEKKDYIWNEKRVQHAVAQGIIQGESIAEIGDRLTVELSAQNANKMNMFARTAFTGAQNAGRQERLKESIEMGVKIQKQWRSLGDNRVRDSHGSLNGLDGQIVDADKPFVIDGNEIMFPGDPTAAPELVYNCRCRMTYVYPKGSKKPDKTQSFEQWQEEKKEEKTKEQKEGTAAIREHIDNHQGAWTLEQRQEVGRMTAQEVEKRVTPETIERKRQELQASLDELKSQKAELLDLADEYNNKALEAAANGEERKSLRLAKKRDATITQIDNLNQKTLKISKQLQNPESGMRESAVREILTELKPCGGVTSDNVEKYGNFDYYKRNSSATKSAAVEAMNVYPSSWLDKSRNSAIMLKPHWTTSRAYYSPYDGEIRFSDRQSTNVHELAHRFEATVPGILQSERDFYAKRTKGESLVWLGPGYDRSEVTRRDKFLSPYMGKDYGGSAFELFSMGSQYAFTDYNRLAQDKDMLDWVLGLLTTID